MATVEIITMRELAAHFGLYRMSPSGDQAIFVRRKVGEPTDYMHTKSIKLKRQREVFGQASAHYSHLTSLQKEDLRHQVEEVEYIQDHGKTGIKVLQGRALFINKDIHALAQTAKQTEMPLTICIVSAEPTGKQIGVELTLRKSFPYPIVKYPASYPYPGTNVFYPVPRLDAQYRLGVSRFPLCYLPYRVYTFDELTKGVIRTCYPYFWENSYGPYCQPTGFLVGNWHFQTPAGANPLWRVNIHEHDGTGWYNFRPYPMVTFNISHYEEDTISIHIDPHQFTYPNIFSRSSIGKIPFWRVSVDPTTGIWTLDPPQRNLIFNYRLDRVVGYY